MSSLQLLSREREMLLAAKEGVDIYPAHVNEGLDYLDLECRGLVHVGPPRTPPADAVQIDVKPLAFVTLTLPGREAAGLQGNCEACGLYVHDLNAGLCDQCTAKSTEVRLSDTAVVRHLNRLREIREGGTWPPMYPVVLSPDDAPVYQNSQGAAIVFDVTHCADCGCEFPCACDYGVEDENADGYRVGDIHPSIAEGC